MVPVLFSSIGKVAYGRKDMDEEGEKA